MGTAGKEERMVSGRMEGFWKIPSPTRRERPIRSWLTGMAGRALSQLVSGQRFWPGNGRFDLRLGFLVTSF